MLITERALGVAVAPRILIVDDHEVVRLGLFCILSKSYPFATFGEADSVDMLLQIVRQQPWDLVLLDISMPGRNGLEGLKDLRCSYPQLPVLILSSHPEDHYALRMLKAGASGYMTKSSAAHELSTAVARVLDGGVYVSQAVTEQWAEVEENPTVDSRLPHEGLSDREYEVLLRLSSGKKVIEIACEMGVSVQSVSTYKSRLLSKMQLNSTADLIRYAIEHELSLQ